MLNFRFHIISLVAVFLALAIGVVMGSAVIDRAVVATLEDQQDSIESRVDEVIADNDALRADLEDLRSRSQRLSEEAGSLLADSLSGVPVAVLAVRGVAPGRVDDLEALLASAGVDALGTLWFNDRLALADMEQRRDLARALDQPEGTPASALRALAVEEVAAVLTDQQPLEGGRGAPDGDLAPDTAGEGAEPLVPPAEEAAGPDLAAPSLVALRDAGFIDFEAPQGTSSDLATFEATRARVVLVTGPGSRLSAGQWARPLTEALVGQPPEPARIPLLVVEVYPADVVEEPGFTASLRADDDLSTRLSTVSRVDDFAGQLATVLALQDLGEAKVGHYGRDAQRLIPAPAG
ncbi:MAG TPA: copper transporter [Acidimicrobiales bacterium]|jgi:hypothetical protein|nr:copper transporter [Acidimicrobiales bacterium]